MPTFTFRNKNTGEEHEEFMWQSEKDKYLEENPHMEQAVNSFAGVGDPIRMSMKKPDSGFRDVLKEMKKKHRGANINTW